MSLEDPIRDFIASEIAALEPVEITPDSASGYGVDLWCEDDLDENLKEVEGIELLGQALYHMLSADDLPDAASYGKDLRRMLHRATSPQELTTMKGEITVVLQKDDRVDSVAVDLSYSYSTKTLTVSIRVTPADPDAVDFTLIITVTDGATHLKAIS